MPTTPLHRKIREIRGTGFPSPKSAVECPSASGQHLATVLQTKGNLYLMRMAPVAPAKRKAEDMGEGIGVCLRSTLCFRQLRLELLYLGNDLAKLEISFFLPLSLSLSLSLYLPLFLSLSLSLSPHHVCCFSMCSTSFPSFSNKHCFSFAFLFLVFFHLSLCRRLQAPLLHSLTMSLSTKHSIGVSMGSPCLRSLV